MPQVATLIKWQQKSTVELNLIHEHGGDMELPEDSDPSVNKTSDGTGLKLRSAKQPPARHLTLSTTQGLRLVLINQEEYRAANFESPPRRNSCRRWKDNKPSSVILSLSGRAK